MIAARRVRASDDPVARVPLCRVRVCGRLCGSRLVGRTFTCESKAVPVGASATDAFVRSGVHLINRARGTPTLPYPRRYGTLTVRKKVRWGMAVPTASGAAGAPTRTEGASKSTVHGSCGGPASAEPSARHAAAGSRPAPRRINDNIFFQPVITLYALREGDGIFYFYIMGGVSSRRHAMGARNGWRTHIHL